MKHSDVTVQHCDNTVYYYDVTMCSTVMKQLFWQKCSSDNMTMRHDEVTVCYCDGTVEN